MPVLELASRPSLWVALLPTPQFWVEQCSHPCSFLETRSPWWAVAAQLLIGFPSILLYSHGWSLSAFITERLLLNGPILRILSTWPSLLFIVIKKKWLKDAWRKKKFTWLTHLNVLREVRPGIQAGAEAGTTGELCWLACSPSLFSWLSFFHHPRASAWGWYCPQCADPSYTSH